MKKGLLVFGLLGFVSAAQASLVCDFKDNSCPSGYRCEPNWISGPFFCVYDRVPGIQIDFEVSANRQGKTDVYGSPLDPETANQLTAEAEGSAKRIADEACFRIRHPVLNYTAVQVSSFSHSEYSFRHLISAGMYMATLYSYEAKATFQCRHTGW